MQDSSRPPFNRIRQFLPQATVAGSMARFVVGTSHHREAKRRGDVNPTPFRECDPSALLLPAGLLNQLSHNLLESVAWPCGLCEICWRENHPSSRQRRLELGLLQEQELSREFLRLANCGAFVLQRPVATIQDAVKRLSRSDCIAILALAAANLLFARQSCCERWRSNLRAALLARMFCEKLQLPEFELAFPATLLHNVGSLLLKASDSLEQGTEDNSIENSAGDSCASLSAWFCLRQGLPPAVVSAVRWQQQPHLAGEHHRLAAIVAITTATACEEQSSCSAPGDGMTWQLFGISNPEEILSSLWHVNRAAISTAAEELAGV